MKVRKLRTIIWDIVLEQEARNAMAVSKKLNDLEAYVHCGVTYGHRFTLIQYLGTCYVFRCTNCGLQYNRPEGNFTKKESDLVDLVYPENKSKGRK